MASPPISRGLRLLGMMLTLAFLLLPLSACTAQTELPFDPLTVTDETSEPEFQYYRIVIPADCSEELYHAAVELAPLVAKATGMDSSVVYDGGKDGRSSHVFEILLGNVDRAVTKDLFRQLRESDYLCRLVEDSLILGGISDGATVSAIHRFRNEILPYATSEVLMAPDGGFFYKHDYATPTMSLNGIPLNEYRIVYPDDASASMIHLAEALSQRIREQTSYSLSVLSHSSYASQGKGLFLTLPQENTSGVSEAFIRPTDKGILFYGNDLLGMSAAVRDFCELLFSFSQNGENCRIEQDKACSYTALSYDIASVAGDHCFPLSSAGDIVNVLSPMATEYQGDLIIFSPVASAQPSYITSVFELNDYTAEVSACSPNVSLITCCKSHVRAEAVSFLSVGTLTVSSYLMGGEKDGFWLVCINGQLDENTSISLSDTVKSSSLPVAILSHVRSAEGARLTISDCGKNLRLTENQTYLQDGLEYTVSCYTTDGMLAVEASHIHDEIGYREFTVKQISFFC